jgi:exodeoxyribonuclease-1
VSFVIYDVETTGLTKGFDQIVQFAAVRTDEELQVLDEVRVRCRLMPHVIPSPRAMYVTGLGIDELIDPSLPSHYEMVRDIRRVLESWRPALFLGFNSLSFDEEFLRQAFYQCLYGPYLTNTQGSARADVLNLCRVTAALRPDVLKAAMDDEGRPVFRLKPLAEANGISVAASHQAMADVATTLALCRRVKAAAPEVWSQFLRFSQKASVEAFITSEDAFLVSETIGNHHRTRVVTRIGRHTEQAIRHYCLDLGTDLSALRAMTDEELVGACKAYGRPVVTIRTNAAPTLWALYDATPEHLAPFDESEVLAAVAAIRNDKDLIRRLCRAAQAAEPVYPASPYVEEQLYERGFPPPQDEALMQRFHVAPWEDRPAIARQFEDGRYRRLSHRLIFFHRPDLLGDDYRRGASNELRTRLSAPVGDTRRWRSIPAAKREMETLIAGIIDDESLARQRRYAEYLDVLHAKACGDEL